MTDIDPLPLCLLIVIVFLQFFDGIFYSSINQAESDIDSKKIPSYVRTFILSGFIFVFLSSIILSVLNVNLAIFVVYFLLYITFFVFFPIFIGRVNPKKAYRISYPVFMVILVITFPVRVLCEGIAAGFSLLFGAKEPLKQSEVTEEDIISMVNVGHKEGVLMTQEANMIQNIFEFDDKDAKDIMIHRGDIIAIDGNESFKDAIELFKESSYSRFPVFINDLDHIIGVVHMRELLEFSLEKTNFPKKIRDLDGIMRPPYFIPETHGINTLFSQMQHKKSHLAIVKDEYGQTSGIISMEDIIEEIVGNIFDEHDEETQSIIDRGDGLYIMFGRTELSDVANCLSITFENDEIETLNGLLINVIGRIPKEHESFTVDYDGYTFEVMDVKDNIIQAVRVRRSTLLEE